MRQYCLKQECGFILSKDAVHPESPARGRTRRAILGAAGALLTRDRGASMSAIAAAAGVGRATLHRYFADRETLVRAIAADALVETRESLQRARPHEGSPRDALRRVVEEFVAMGPRYGFLVAESTVTDDQRFLAEDRASMQPVVDLIVRGQAERALRDDLPADWLLSTMEAIIYAGWVAIERDGLGVGEATRMVVAALEGGLLSRGRRSGS